MSNILLAPGEKLRIELLGSKDLGIRLPEVFEGFVDAIESINQRFTDEGKQAKIALIML